MSDIVEKAINRHRELKTIEVYHRKASVIQGDMMITAELEHTTWESDIRKWVVFVLVSNVGFLQPMAGIRHRKFWRYESAIRYFERIVREYEMKVIE